MREYTVKVAAGGMEQVAVDGNFCRVKQAANEIMLEAPDLAEFAYLSEGDAVSFHQFKRLNVRNPGPVEITVKLWVGLGTRVDAARIGGTVSVIDGGVYRSENGQAFIHMTAQAAVAGQYSHVQLWNPVGSGKRAIVNSIRAYASSSSSLFLTRHDATIGAFVNNANSKFLYQPNTVLEIWKGTDAAMLGISLARSFSNGAEFGDYVLTEPLILDPGYGLVAIAEIVNVQLRAIFQGFLKDI